MSANSDRWNGVDRRQPALNGADRRKSPRHSYSGEQGIDSLAFHSIEDKSVIRDQAETKSHWEAYGDVPPVE